MQKTSNLKTMYKLAKLPTAILRLHHNQHIAADYIICINDNVSTQNWLTDVIETPEDYPDYTAEQLQDFLTLIN